MRNVAAVLQNSDLYGAPLTPSDVTRKLGCPVVIPIAVNGQNGTLNPGQQVVERKRSELRRQPNSRPGVQHPRGSLTVPAREPGELPRTAELLFCGPNACES